MHTSVRDSWIRFNSPLEGRVSHMYLDMLGFVTTALGNKIDATGSEKRVPTPGERSASHSKASGLRWMMGNAPATPAQVAAAWDAVKSRLDLVGRAHGAFENLTGLRITDAEIDRFAMSELGAFESGLKAHGFPAFDTWPANAQLAVLSMGWAMGPAFSTKFPKFTQHVAARNWVAAAEESQIKQNTGTLKVRNDLNRRHLLHAQAVVERGLPLDRIALDLSDPFGVQGALLAVGENPGQQDGADGKNMRAAVAAYQGKHRLPVTGVWSDTDTRSVLAADLNARGYTVLPPGGGVPAPAPGPTQSVPTNPIPRPAGASFSMPMSNPFRHGFTNKLGGPREGGHGPGEWYNEYGMDLGAPAGTPVYAAFDAVVTKFFPRNPSGDSGKIYGAQIFMRYPNDRMGAFYTHLNSVPDRIKNGAAVKRGDHLGNVMAFQGISPHLHMAVVEIIGGLPGGKYQGVNLYPHFCNTANSDKVYSVTFNQNGSAPIVG